MHLYILCREVRNVATCKVHLYLPDTVIFASSNEIFDKDILGILVTEQWQTGG
jgi:hypothetical protein